MDNLDQQIKDRFNELPEKIRAIITESGWENKIRNIAKNNNLHIDQGGAIETETLLVMLGFEGPEDYIENIKKEGNLTTEQADKIGEEVATDIFGQIRSALVESTDEEPSEIGSKKSILQEHLLDRNEIVKEMGDDIEIIDDSTEIEEERNQKEAAVEIVTEKKETTEPPIESILENNLKSVAPTNKEDIVIEGIDKTPKPSIDPYRESFE